MLAQLGQSFAILFALLLFCGGLVAMLLGLATNGTEGIKALIFGIALIAFALRIGEEMRH